MLRTQYRGIVGITRIFTNYRKNLRINNRRYRQNVDSTSTNEQEQHIGRFAKEYGYGSRMVQWGQCKI